GQPPRYLKFASGAHVRELRAERDRLHWLQSRLPVPAVCGWAEAGDDGPVDADEREERARGWLLLSEAPGRMACDPAFEGDPQRVVELLAAGLHSLHGLDIAACSFDARLDHRLAQAAWVIHAGIADVEAVRADLGVSAEELLARLITTRPDEPTADLVFTHGDYCLPNILLDAECDRISAYLDWGRAGIADRYQDLSIGARSVRFNLGEEWSERFLAAYGLSPLDRARLDWYETLDELF
ncbi:MAG: APH(3') family aminoglycoside O-phosphotransferase, partial [Ktedonobacterales bacterium]